MRGRADYGACRGVPADRGPGRTRGIPCLRREPSRRGGLAGADHDPVAARRLLPCPGAGRAGAGPGLRVRPHRPGRRHVHGPGPDGQHPAQRPVRRGAAPVAARARRPAGAAAADPAAAPGGPRPPSAANGAPALQGPGRDRDLAPLRRVQHVLRVGARALDGLHLRVLPERGRHAGGGAGLQARPGRPQARAASGYAAARRGLRLGRHGHARGSRVRRQGARCDPVRAAGAVGPAGDQGAGPVGPGRGPAPRLPGRGRGRL